MKRLTCVGIASLCLAAQAWESDQAKPARTRVPREKPCLMIWWRGGMRELAAKERDRDVYLRVAVWKNGRIVWREPAQAGSWDGKVWSYRPGRYFEARVPPETVRRALAQIRATGIYAHGRYLEPSIPDSQETVVELNDGRLRTTLGSTNEPEGSPSPSWEKHWPTFLRAWKTAHREIMALVPKSGQPFPRPEPIEMVP